MKKITRLDIVVALLAGLSCFFMAIPSVNFPVWALFIGWAWYFAEGAQPKAFRRAIPPMLYGYACAAISAIVFAAFGFQLYVLALIVAITVFAIMLSTKANVFSMSLASFNAFSCMFAGYYAGNFPALADGGAADWKNALIAALWIAFANVVGLCFGWLSIKLGVKE
ncbi:MAG: DUF1097 domain-containing protein [Oscillospiraceae bacterium]|nr:DUF1097 domain-containing protein [Oscillospiraceae bacterium]